MFVSRDFRAYFFYQMFHRASHFLLN
jgi:hypothetical protein